MNVGRTEELAYFSLRDVIDALTEKKGSGKEVLYSFYFLLLHDLCC